MDVKEFITKNSSALKQGAWMLGALGFLIGGMVCAYANIAELRTVKQLEAKIADQQTVIAHLDSLNHDLVISNVRLQKSNESMEAQLSDIEE